MRKVAVKIQSDLIDAIERDELELPTLPEVAIRVRQVAEDPNAGIPELVREISSDTTLSALLVRMANSPLLRTRQHISDVTMAVNRLGTVYTASLAMGLAMTQLFKAKNESIETKMRLLLNQSTKVAAIAHALCKRYAEHILKPDQAVLAGMTHKIGVLPILTYVDTHNLLLNDPEGLNAIIESTDQIVGDKILTEWDFPAQLQMIPSQHQDFSRVSSRLDYGHIVQVAWLRTLPDDHPVKASLDLESLESVQRIGIKPDELTGEMSDELAASLRFFG